MPAEKGPHALTPEGLDGPFLRAGGCRAARAPLTYTRRCTPDLGAAAHPQPAHERPFARAFRRWGNRPSSSRWWGWTSHFSELAARERHAPPQHAPEGTLRILAPPVTHRPIARFYPPGSLRVVEVVGWWWFLGNSPPQKVGQNRPPRKPQTKAFLDGKSRVDAESGLAAGQSHVFGCPRPILRF